MLEEPQAEMGVGTSRVLAAEETGPDPIEATQGGIDGDCGQRSSTGVGGGSTARTPGPRVDVGAADIHRERVTGADARAVVARDEGRVVGALGRQVVPAARVIFRPLVPVGAALLVAVDGAAGAACIVYAGSRSLGGWVRTKRVHVAYSWACRTQSGATLGVEVGSVMRMNKDVELVYMLCVRASLPLLRLLLGSIRNVILSGSEEGFEFVSRVERLYGSVLFKYVVYAQGGGRSHEVQLPVEELLRGGALLRRERAPREVAPGPSEAKAVASRGAAPQIVAVVGLAVGAANFQSNDNK
ncbi:hypothetical protein FIBSPDRAFT_890070 [Athelia psychrophila]|uniref:Uncharacterized protein n=1 Tax=Athelia psychrophila TaxID=1759441 RepID=A0A166L952_9AGAM|nr:hypothetical protein FIBSPDRAFT_890070 [Fibularhizoctonia sp. CBS 109695]